MFKRHASVMLSDALVVDLVELIVGLSNLKGFFQPKRFCSSMNAEIFSTAHSIVKPGTLLKSTFFSTYHLKVFVNLK